MNIPFEKIDDLADTIDKNAQVVMYCSNYQCTSSDYAARRLCKKGFSNVCEYEAGMADWYQHGHPVTGECKQNYLKDKIEKVEVEDDEVDVISTDSLKDMIKRMLAVNITS